MIELIVNKDKDKKTITVLENGKIVEIYEENKENQRERNEGNIYSGIVKDIIPGMQAAFIDIGIDKTSFIHVKDILPQIDEKLEKRKEVQIKQAIKPRQKLLVQVQKDSNDKKGARTSTHIKITGKYVILMPNTTILTISQKIEDEKEKERLLKIVKEKLPNNTGAIIRTSAEKKKANEIIADIERLEKIWAKITDKYNKIGEKAGLLHQSPDIIEKIILDMTEEKIERIVINDKTESEELKKKNDKIKVEFEEGNLIKKYDLEKQIQKAEQRKIWLNCGGFITIDATEALVAIDVNSGKFTGKTTLEDTIYKVNYEATLEIAKQIRLRDIGGIIIIDYIDMKKEENKEKIEKLLKETLKQDRAKTQVEGFTKLNLMEMTRKHICSHNS